MAGFIYKSACHGRNPGNGTPHRHIVRPELTARLLRERHVARFIVAPGGFGKTELALEYADTVFAFRHTFWINGKSPCFIRDLDAGRIVEECLGADADAALVVFDDIGVFESDRVTSFSQTVDVLLSNDVEVIVTCTPAADAYGALHRDRVRLGTQDLLLTDAELERGAGAAAASAAEHGERTRICGLAWGAGADAEGRFLTNVLSDDLSADYLLALGAMLALVQGRIDGLDAALHLAPDALETLACDYPFLGIDDERESFAAYRFDPVDLHRAYKRRMDSMVLRSSCATRDELARSWAQRLALAGEGRRACELVERFCSKRPRAQWASDQGISLLRAGNVLPLHRLIASAQDARCPQRVWCTALDAVCRSLLGDADGALMLAKHPAFDPTTALRVRAVSLYVVARNADNTLSAAALAEAQRLIDDAGSSGHASDDAPWVALLELTCAQSAGLSGLVALWRKLADEYAGGERIEREREIAAAMLARAAERVHATAVSDDDILQTTSEAAAFSFSLVEEKGAAAGLFVCQAAAAFERLRVSDVPLDVAAPSPMVLFDLREHELEMLRQRQEFGVLERDSQVAHADRIATNPDAYLTARVSNGLSARQRRAPQMNVRLFGRLEVAIGGEQLDAGLFDNQRSGELLAILTLNKGREMTRESLAAQLWSDNVRTAATKNFYTVWSNLRNALRLADGSCPYLVRRRNGCSLDERLVTSDIDRFDQICRALVFGQVDVGEWGELYRELEEGYACDLLPIEQRNLAIVQTREDMRARLIDALTIASQRLVAVGEAKWGIWFARMAYQRDALREDAAVALMEAQIAAGQRTAALKTYLSCRRSLATQLGIDPSKEARDLYEELIQDQ